MNPKNNHKIPELGFNGLISVEDTLDSRISRRAFSNQKIPDYVKSRILSRPYDNSGYLMGDQKLFMLDSDKQDVDLSRGILRNWITVARYGDSEMILPAKVRAYYDEILFLCFNKQKKREHLLPPSYLVSAVSGGEEREYDTSFGKYSVKYSLVFAAAEHHKTLLAAKENGIDSCMHGILDAKIYLTASGLSDKYDIALVSPLGYSPAELTKIEIRIRNIAGADKRIDITQILSNNGLSWTDSETELEMFLDNVIKGPSAGNDQPWKFYQDGETLHLCVDLSAKKEVYRTAHLREMDAGIAMATMSMLALENNISKSWEIESNPNIRIPSEQVYIASFK